MKIWYDTEFLEDGDTIELISIGMVAEDGRTLYLVNRDFTWSRIARRVWWAPWRWEIRQPWLLEHVVPHLPQLHGDARLHYAGSGPLGLLDRQNWTGAHYQPRETIAREVRSFVQATPDVELWADYSAYDHVALCQLYGRMIDLPFGFPMWTHDFQQLWEAAGRPSLPGQDDGLHNALADAEQLARCHKLVLRRAGERTNG